MSQLYRGKEASTPLTQLNQLKVALGFEQHFPVATIIQYLEDGIVTVKHSKDVPEQVISESEASSLAAAASGTVDHQDAPDINDPAKIVETPTHRPEPTAAKPQDAKAETAVDKQDTTQSVDVKEQLKQAKADEKDAPKNGPTIVKDEDLKPLSAPVDDDKDSTKKK